MMRRGRGMPAPGLLAAQGVGQAHAMPLRADAEREPRALPGRSLARVAQPHGG
jgi:hypothetical protein